MRPRENREHVLPAQAAVPEGDHHGQPVADHHHDDGERPQEVDVAVTACGGGGGEVPNPHPVLRHRASSEPALGLNAETPKNRSNPAVPEEYVNPAVSL